MMMIDRSKPCRLPDSMVSYYSVVEHRMQSSVWFARELLTILDDEMMQTT